MLSNNILRLFLCVLPTAFAAAASSKSASASSISTEGRLYTDEYSRTALSWPYSRASVHFKGSSHVTAVLQDSGFDTHNLPAAVSFSAETVRDFEATREEGLLKLTLRGLDPTRSSRGVITKLDESDDGEILLLQFEIDMHGRSGHLHWCCTPPHMDVMAEAQARGGLAAFWKRCPLWPQIGSLKSLGIQLG